MPAEGNLDILRDMAVVMAVSGGVILLFHWLRQPVILGYIVAGAIIGPYTPPFPLVGEVEVINVLADLGIILLMFALGLEFSLGKLRRVGKVAVIGGAIQLIIMFTIGYQVGLLLGWSALTSLFLGAGLSISSTALIVKVLEEQRLMSDRASQAIIGILVFEDFAAMAMIALLSGLGSGEGIHLGDIGLVVLKLLAFGSVSIILGQSVVRYLLNYVAASGSRELSVVVGLGLCFGMALVSRWMGLSVAAGAFLAGALVAEVRRSGTLSHSVIPIRDMFAAIFFVAIGMLFNPAFIKDYWLQTLLITLVLIGGKLFAGTIASLILGYHHHTAIRVGMGLAQIGEFSLIIVKIGQDNGTAEPFLYPVIVGVTALSTLTTPYIIRASINAGERLDSLLPPRLRRYIHSSDEALQHIQTQAGERGVYGELIRRHITNILINIFLFASIVILGRIAYENREFVARLTRLPDVVIITMLALALLALASIPLIAIVRYVQSLADIGAEAVTASRERGFILHRPLVRVVLRNTVTTAIFMVMVMMVSLFLPRIPSVPYLPFLMIGSSLMVAVYLLWKSLEAFHHRVEELVRGRFMGEEGLEEETQAADAGKDDG